GKVVSTIDSRALDGRWSPDGTRVAFVRHEPGLGRVLFVVSSDGRGLTRIAAQVQTFGFPAFSWSPDGTKLVYAAQGASGLMIADASGRHAPHRVPIATGAGEARLRVVTVKWNPDGSLIGFISGDDPADWQINVVHPDGTSLHRLANGESFDWAPDGKRLVIEATGETGVSVVNTDGSHLRRIAGCRCDLRGEGSGGSLVTWSPDGTRIAYVSGRANTVSTIRPIGSGATVLATH